MCSKIYPTSTTEFSSVRSSWTDSQLDGFATEINVYSSLQKYITVRKSTKQVIELDLYLVCLLLVLFVVTCFVSYIELETFTLTTVANWVVHFQNRLLTSKFVHFPTRPLPKLYTSQLVCPLLSYVVRFIFIWNPVCFIIKFNEFLSWLYSVQLRICPVEGAFSSQDVMLPTSKFGIIFTSPILAPWYVRSWLRLKVVPKGGFVPLRHRSD